MQTHPTPTWLSASELSEQVVTAFAAPSTNYGELRASVHALVGIWKREHWPIERMIIELKRFVAAAQERHSVKSTWLEIRELGDRAITWCIERYYLERR